MDDAHAPVGIAGAVAVSEERLRQAEAERDALHDGGPDGGHPPRVVLDGRLQGCVAGRPAVLSVDGALPRGFARRPAGLQGSSA